MGKQQKRPGDVTGRKAEELAAKAAEELKERKAEIALATAAAEEERQNEVVDLTSNKPAPKAEVEASDAVEVEQPYVNIRVNDTLEHVTIGQGNHYDRFEPGRTYKVPKFVADHLEEKGFVWH